MVNPFKTYCNPSEVWIYAESGRKLNFFQRYDKTHGIINTIVT